MDLFKEVLILRAYVEELEKRSSRIMVTSQQFMCGCKTVRSQKGGKR